MPLLQRVAGVLLGALFLAAVLVFASIALVVLAALGLAGWAWLWWRSRSKPAGRIIEGEFQRLEDGDEQRL
jgi:hypothetical protein